MYRVFIIKTQMKGFPSCDISISYGLDMYQRSTAVAIQSRQTEMDVCMHVHFCLKMGPASLALASPGDETRL